MLIPHLRCIFVHIPKNAGISIERFFLEYLGLGRESRPAFLCRPNEDPALGPPRLAHLKAYEYISCGHVSRQLFDDYVKFAVVRNPWDRMISLYHYFGEARKSDFTDFLFNRFYNKLWQEKYWFTCPQKDFIYDDSGELLVDFVVRFENLQDDFNRVCDRLGVPKKPLPHMNSSRNQRELKMKPYQDYYNSETRYWVTELFKADIEQFGYSFDDPNRALVSNR